MYRSSRYRVAGDRAACGIQVDRAPDYQLPASVQQRFVAIADHRATARVLTFPGVIGPGVCHQRIKITHQPLPIVSNGRPFAAPIEALPGVQIIAVVASAQGAAVTDCAFDTRPRGFGCRSTLVIPVPCQDGRTGPPEEIVRLHAERQGRTADLDLSPRLADPWTSCYLPRPAGGQLAIWQTLWQALMNPKAAPIADARLKTTLI